MSKTQLRRKICVVTGTRAEYGLLRWLMEEIKRDPELELQIIATGMHLAPEFGLTYQAIEEDGFKIDQKVEMLLSSDTSVGTAKSLGLGTISMSDALERLSPDIVVLLGDRFEILAAAQVAMMLRIPLAHIHGGELTEGLTDEAIRHTLTKLSHLHFVAAEPYRKRVIQLGEQPSRVFNFGAIGGDGITYLPLKSKKELESALGFSWIDPVFVVTYHPVTLQNNEPASAIAPLFEALDRFPKAKILFTKSNADPTGRSLGALIDQYGARQKGRVHVSTSLGQLLYLSALKNASVVIGNSSSGLIEAPFLKIPTVNIGIRQKGRLKASSIIDCEDNADAITKAIEVALSPEFCEKLKNIDSPYGTGAVSKQIKEVLKSVSLDGILFKTFFDLPVNA